MAELLRRLEASLGSNVASEERGRILAKKIIYLARIGDFAEAREITSILRSEFTGTKSGLVTPWVMLAEGLLQRFEELSPGALDRVIRSQLLADAVKDETLSAFAHAWRAQLEFERSNFDEMARSISAAMALAHESNLAAWTRIGICLCEVYACIGCETESKLWFGRARESALKEGDQASLEAVFHGRVAFRLSYVRAKSCIEELDRVAVRQLRGELDSARNLQGLLGLRALTDLVNLCDARLYLLEGNFAAALKRFRELTLAPPGVSSYHPKLLELEVSYCEMQLGESPARPEPDWEPSFLSLDLDDQLVAAWLIVEIRRRLGYSVVSHEVALTSIQQQFSASLDYMRALFQGFSERGR